MKKIVVSILLCVVAMVSCSKQVEKLNSIHDLDKSIRANLGEPIQCDTFLMPSISKIPMIIYIYPGDKLSMVDAAMYLESAYGEELKVSKPTFAYLPNDSSLYHVTLRFVESEKTDSTFIYIGVNDIDNELGLISENGK